MDHLSRPRPRPLDRSMSLRMEALDALNNLEELGQAAEEDLRNRKLQQERMRVERLERLGGFERPSEVGRASKSSVFTSRELSRRDSRSSNGRPRRPSKETGGPTHSHSRTNPLDAVFGARSEKVNLGDLAEEDLVEASIAIEVDGSTADSNKAQSSEGDLDSLPERQASQVMRNLGESLRHQFAGIKTSLRAGLTVFLVVSILLGLLQLAWHWINASVLSHISGALEIDAEMRAYWLVAPPMAWYTEIEAEIVIEIESGMEVAIWRLSIAPAPHHNLVCLVVRMCSPRRPLPTGMSP